MRKFTLSCNVCRVLNSQHSSPWLGAVIILIIIIKRLVCLSMGFILWFEVDSIAFSFHTHIFRELRKRVVCWGSWVPAGGRPSRVCLLPADEAAGSTQPSEPPQAGHSSAIGVICEHEFSPSWRVPLGQRESEHTLCCTLYCLFRNGNNLYFMLNKHASSGP